MTPFLCWGHLLDAALLNGPGLLPPWDPHLVQGKLVPPFPLVLSFGPSKSVFYKSCLLWLFLMTALNFRICFLPDNFLL